LAAHAKADSMPRVNLLRKQIIDSAVCEVCEQEDESADHVIVGCPFAKEFWAKLGIDLPMDTSNVASDLHNIQLPQPSLGNT